MGKTRDAQSPQFAVVDVETTGLFANGSDRVVEIAILRMGSDGKFLDEYTTLVNPKRDLGPTHIHGISGREVLNAPEFHEIMGDILSRLEGAVFVGHNVEFDYRFIQAEFHRAGVMLPELYAVCTMQLAYKIVDNLPSRKLEICCRHFGIPIESTHCAYHDAVATARLLVECLRRADKWAEFCSESMKKIKEISAQGKWPRISPSGKLQPRSFSGEKPKYSQSFVNRLVEALPPGGKLEIPLDPYFGLLDRVLEDRILTREESEALIELGKDLHLGKDQLMEAHRRYMRDLIAIACRDGMVTDREMADLRDVAELLSIAKSELEKMLLDEKASNPPHALRKSERQVAGKTICFTGELTCKIGGEIPTRELAERMASKHGMVVQKSVTKSLDYLVVADPFTQSGKARKARSYNVTILAEPVFWRMLGIDFE